MGNVLVIAQIQDREMKKSTAQVATFAAEVAKLTGGAYDVLALGADLAKAEAQLKQLGAREVLIAQAPDLDQPLAERYAPIIAAVVQAGGYQVVAAPATSTFKDVLPRLAWQLGAGMASEVTGVALEGGKLVYGRPVYAGNVVMRVQISTPIEVVTVRATEFAAREPAGSSPVKAVTVGAPEAAAAKVTFVGFEKSVSARPDLTEARVVVSGGRGVKAKENFPLIEELADLLGGAVGATRAAVDAGFIHNDFQVGQTGKIVAPDLYIACGISGALQHVAGMKGSRVIVAINKDEEAPIFQVADYGYVGDLFKVIPELVTEIKRTAR